jgi:hypothetical protein
VPGELRLAGSVLEERFHADTGVVGAEALDERVGLEVETLCKRYTEAVVDRALR